MAIYITGDTHRSFERIFEFCEENETTTDDVMVILGDACINYYCDFHDTCLKQDLLELPITLFCVHGNHEERPELLGYEEKEWHGATVFYEPTFPNLLFAKDGEVYDFDGKKVLVIGGAYSIDKYYRLQNGLPWFESELPTEQTMEYVEKQLDKVGWNVDCVFSHTVPIDYEPVWAFLPGINQNKVDKTMERWLQKIAENLEFEHWYAGHYHVESEEGPVRIMYEDYEELY